MLISICRTSHKQEKAEKKTTRLGRRRVETAISGLLTNQTQRHSSENKQT